MFPQVGSVVVLTGKQISAVLFFSADAKLQLLLQSHFCVCCCGSFTEVIVTKKTCDYDLPQLLRAYDTQTAWRMPIRWPAAAYHGFLCALSGRIGMRTCSWRVQDLSTYTEMVTLLKYTKWLLCLLLWCVAISSLWWREMSVKKFSQFTLCKAMALLFCRIVKSCPLMNPV